MALIENIVEAILARISAEKRARLLEIAADKFFAGMTADEKQQLVEKLIRRLLDEVDVKALFPQIMAMMWKEAGDSALMEKMTKVAVQTGGRLSDIFADFIRKE